MAKKRLTIDFSTVSGGLNLINDRLKIGKNQVSDGTINAVLTDTGPERVPGTDGLSASQTFTTFLKGLHIYRQLNGTEKLLAMSNGILYEVNTTTEALTLRATLTGTGEASFENFMGKAWICNGTEIYKLENETALQVGITPPSGSTAVKAAGGSLTAGVWKVIISYFRKVSGSIVLYSVGETLSDVTLETTNLTIDITAPDSSDPQVGGITVWLSGPADAGVFFSYGTKDGSGAYSTSITDDTNRTTSLNYSVQALNNQRPKAFTHINFHDLRLWGVDPTDKSVVWYSKRASTVYDLERFPNQALTTNKIDYRFDVIGTFSLGDHLYINTTKGIIRQDFGDPGVAWEWADKRFHFENMNSIVQWKTSVVGLTNDGVRIFDGLTFSEDISKQVKPEIDKMYNTATNFKPNAEIFRNDNRTEYHLFYQDTEISSVLNNRRLVLNLDKVFIDESGRLSAPWELWDMSAGYTAIDSSNVFFHGQSISGDSHIYKLKKTNSVDLNVYNQLGEFQTISKNKLIKIVSRAVLSDIAGRARYTILRGLAQISSNATLTVIVADAANVNSPITFISDSEALWDSFNWGAVNWSLETPLPFKKALKISLKGYSVYMQLEQIANDPNFKVLNTFVEATVEKGRFS